MGRKEIKDRLIKLLNITPEIREIMFSTDPINEKRIKIRSFLSSIIDNAIYDNPSPQPLEWVVTRDAIWAFKSILSTRNESIGGFSLLQYMDDFIHKEDLRDIPLPNKGFFAEMEHLLKGVMGKSGLYKEKMPAFAKYEGLKAAKLRSLDLSRMARTAGKFIDQYPDGLNKNIIHERMENKARILDFFKGKHPDWDDWKWHIRHIIRDADTLRKLVDLTDEEYRAIKMARKNKIPFGITPYYLSLMDWNASRKRDYAIRAQVIPSLHYVEKLIELRALSEHSMDFMLEKDTSPIEGITRRYPMIVILKPVLTCPQICVYCQRNWEIEDVYSRGAILTKDKLEKAIRWISETPEITEVLVTGGDPLILSNEKIASIISKLSRIKNIQRIRIGTRTPVTLPQRITESLTRTLNRFHIPGRREILIVTHFEHPYEVTPQSMEAVQKIRHYGIEVYNQLVYTFYNSRKFEAAALRLKLRLIGVTSYYTFNTKGKEETDDYRVPIPRLLQEQGEEARLLPGAVRTDEIVFNVPRLGKNYLRAMQHRDLITILPDGCRIYEFHPWEKKLSLADTYIYKDVSVYDYLEKLKSVGEDISQYRSIWYYY